MHHVHQRHVTHHFMMSYPVSMRARIYTLFVGPLAVVVLIALFAAIHPPSIGHATVTLPEILLATLYTSIRIAIAYVFAVVVSFPLALLVERSRVWEGILLPVFDVFESIPNLAVLPVLVIFFTMVGFPDGAAIVVLFLNMIWNIVFALVGGLKVIPKDVTYAAHMFGLHDFSYLRRLVIPAVFPQFVTGSILAVAQGWNIIMVAEAIHIYLPPGSAHDLFGIGGVLVATSASGQTGAYALAFFVMVAVIGLFNFFVWQRLLNYSQRFRFE